MGKLWFRAAGGVLILLTASLAAQDGYAASISKAKPPAARRDDPWDVTINDEYQRTLAPLVAKGTWVFFTSCRLGRRDRQTLVFPVGQTKGFYAQFDETGRQDQGADITVGKTVEANEFMGGEGTMAAQMMIVKGMLRSRFQLVEPSRLEVVFKSQPATQICALALLESGPLVEQVRHNGGDSSRSIVDQFVPVLFLTGRANPASIKTLQKISS